MEKDVCGRDVRAPDSLRIIARSVPWKRTPGCRLRWDALTEEGEVLVEGTEYPMADGAYALARRERGRVSLLTPVTMRHEGKGGDVFVPMPLIWWVKKGKRRLMSKEKMLKVFGKGGGVTIR